MRLLYVETSENLLLEYNLAPENLLVLNALIQQSSQEPSPFRSSLDTSNASSRRLRKSVLYLLFHLFRRAIASKFALSNFAVLQFYLSSYWIIKPPFFLSCRRTSHSSFPYTFSLGPSFDGYCITLQKYQNLCSIVILAVSKKESISPF